MNKLELQEEAIVKVMEFYNHTREDNHSREDIIQYYWGEVESMMRLITMGVFDQVDQDGE